MNFTLQARSPRPSLDWFRSQFWKKLCFPQTQWHTKRVWYKLWRLFLLHFSVDSRARTKRRMRLQARWVCVDVLCSSRTVVPSKSTYYLINVKKHWLFSSNSSVLLSKSSKSREPWTKDDDFESSVRDTLISTHYCVFSFWLFFIVRRGF